MPASHSRQREPDRPVSTRRIWPFALLALLIGFAVAAAALPASLILHFLPPPIQAEDLSGTIWHGSAARITVDSRPVGALEWRLHPLPLLALSTVLDLRWVKGSTVIGGQVMLDRLGFAAHDVRGGGAIDDFRDLGLAPGWRGNTALDLREIKGTFDHIASAAGTLDISALAADGIADGSDLGNYRLTLPSGDTRSPDADADALSATIEDQGGPLETHAEVRYTAASRTVSLSGTLKERPETSPALRAELSNLSQLKPRDGSGRIPVEIEFTL